jgi:hypothetical protein
VTLVGDVTLGSGPSLYTSLGDVLGWVAMAGFVFFIVFPMVIESRAKKAAKKKVNLKRTAHFRAVLILQRCCLYEVSVYPIRSRDRGKIIPSFTSLSA